MTTNFTQCALRYIGNQTLESRYSWRGPTHLIDPNSTTQITFAGCLEVCGRERDWYPWSQSSATITTWILPVIGMLLQAPFESNAFSQTMFALARWVGSPMASLSYILWNISVSGKCALMVDMSIPYDERVPDRGSDFASLRDSFFILTNMNQYTMKPVISLKKEVEGLLRIVLFSKDLPLKGTNTSLQDTREELAQNLREGRKRGVVPVFIATAWFLFSLAISIQTAFGFIGENAQAHDLALGLLLAWMPVLILCSIVDRNPVASEDIRKRLNGLVDLVCWSLANNQIRNDFVARFRDQPEGPRMREWVEKIATMSQHIEGNFFVSFAGQGRVRWHYGAAHPILSDIENCYVADHGRNWLQYEEEARANLVLGPVGEGLIWFDKRELWQIVSAMIIVSCTVFGAFTLSYYTPTVGLGCRSGGYVIFFIFSVSLLVGELLVWWFSSPVRPDQMKWLARGSTRLQSISTFNRLEQQSSGMVRRVNSSFGRFKERLEDIGVQSIVTIGGLFYRRDRTTRSNRLERKVRQALQTYHGYSLREWTDRFVFKPLEVINALWLVYIVIAQTMGIYNTCECKSSIWGTMGGYVDLQQTTFTDNPLIIQYWAEGVVLSATVMGLAMMYVVVEWCIQSHLNTGNYHDARRGLVRTRRFRVLTFYLRYPFSKVIHGVNSFRHRLWRLLKIKPGREQKSLVWTRYITFDYKPLRTNEMDFEVLVHQPSPNLHEGSEFLPLADTPLIHVREPDETHTSPGTNLSAEPALRRLSSSSNPPRISFDSSRSPRSASDASLNVPPGYPRQNPQQ
ncbi:hypothetical protein P152DRAFT_446422 [Eremomyces bilateralis CBS 781.70]|uniref:Uncharacterized protein n=1 Tax=Eremomyces bilateralis CBS 781.70 TaxID=1392243 RepID=A0A6G1GB70_9PEZI|nr:uncharacterized protein P152DRAFT_446422 [Eremomyces bilateralis CBS 781.70]KAF1815347.1 hypothetical protein P152DRAFT_446422 [Eremomyces bilateralis CBS 781.70]